MPLQGKGFFIWKIPLTEGGAAAAIARMAAEAGFTHVLIKVADGNYSYNLDSSGRDLVPAVVEALRARGIQAWGWHYVYGYDPIGEADIAIRRVRELGLDGYVIDAEAQYKEPDRASAARTYMNRLRSGLSNTPIALSSYRYPSYHPRLPWREFLAGCDYNMPQVYWMQSTNAGEQLIRCVREFQDIAPGVPIIPVGAAFRERGWEPQPGEIIDFLDTARQLNLSAANFYEWANCRLYLPQVWDTIRQYSWAVASPVPEMAQQLIDALNSRDPNQVAALYTDNAVHVTVERTAQGKDNLRNWYNRLLNQVLPNATFRLAGYSGEGPTRHFTWTATSSRGSVRNGSDTIGLTDGKIAYHFTSYRVSS